MAFTYSGDPTASSRDKVRFLLSDTDAATPLLTDEEIAWLLAQNANVYLAAAEGAGIIGRKFSRQADKTTGDLSISYSTRARTWAETAAGLVSQSNRRSVPTPFSGGHRILDKEGNAEDTALVQPAFVRGGMDDPGQSTTMA